MELELDPPQPDSVSEAVAKALEAVRQPDPWWQAGVEEALHE